MKKTKVIIVLGLGDDMHNIGRFISLPDIETEIFAVGWRKPVESPKAYFEARLCALVEKIDRAYQDGYKVVLIGTSAGGSFVVNAFHERESEVSLVVNVSGRLTLAEGPTFVPFAKYRKTELVFMESVTRSERLVQRPSSLFKRRFLAYVPLYDQLVPLKSMSFDGARRKRVWLVEHIANIFSVFIVYRSHLIRAIRDA